MYNWSTDEKELKKNPVSYTIWKLEQLINFGLCGKKISEHKLRKYWDRLQIDQHRKNFLSLLLHGENNSH